jgi:hypothetical protein
LRRTTVAAAQDEKLLSPISKICRYVDVIMNNSLFKSRSIWLPYRLIGQAKMPHVGRHQVWQRCKVGKDRLGDRKREKTE